MTKEYTGVHSVIGGLQINDDDDDDDGNKRN